MEFFSTLSPGRQRLLLAGVGLVVAAAVATAVYFTWLRSPYKVLFSDLRANEAATILADLDKRKVPYRLENEGRTILVPARVADATRVNLAAEDLPLKGAVGFELFNKSDMGLTEFAQQINYRRALQGELARTIMSLEGVESARVHLSLAEPAVFREDRRAAKASVTVLVRPGRVLAPGVVRGVQALVAAAVPDLDAAHVVVLDGRGDVISEAPVPAAFAAPAGPVETVLAEAVRLAARQAFHDRPIAVEVVAPRGATAEPPGEGEVLPRRDFPVRVRLQVEGELTPAERADLQQLAIIAAELDPARGDALVIEPSSPRPSSSGAPAQLRPAALPSAPSARPALSVSVILGLLLIALLAVVWRLQAGARRGRLSPAQKAAYAARLQRLLGEEGSHARADV